MRSMLKTRPVTGTFGFFGQRLSRESVRLNHDNFFGGSVSRSTDVSDALPSLVLSPDFACPPLPWPYRSAERWLASKGVPSQRVVHVSSICSRTSSMTTFLGKRKEPLGRLSKTSFRETSCPRSSIIAIGGNDVPKDDRSDKGNEEKQGTRTTAEIRFLMPVSFVGLFVCLREWKESHAIWLSTPEQPR